MANFDLSSVPNLPDTFFGNEFDKKLIDRLTRDLTKIRGQNFFYFIKKDAAERQDGNRPISNNPNLGTFDPKGRAGSAALYGEPVIIGNNDNAVKRNVDPSWFYSEPIEVRGVIMNTQRADTPDERGRVEIRKATLYLSRAMCDDIGLTPTIGDVVKLPAGLHGFYDIATVTRDNHRFGGTGFFSCYDISLYRNTRFLADRKELPQQPV